MIKDTPVLLLSDRPEDISPGHLGADERKGNSGVYCIEVSAAQVEEPGGIGRVVADVGGEHDWDSPSPLHADEPLFSHGRLNGLCSLVPTACLHRPQGARLADSPLHSKVGVGKDGDRHPRGTVPDQLHESEAGARPGPAEVNRRAVGSRVLSRGQNR